MKVGALGGRLPLTCPAPGPTSSPASSPPPAPLAPGGFSCLWVLPEPLAGGFCLELAG